MCKITTICLQTKDFEYFCTMNNFIQEDTICALATGGGTSAIALIRISGKDSIKITNTIFSKNLENVKSHTIHFGTILDNNEIIDEVIISVFHKNKSFTGEETIEVSCHGSLFIQKKILEILINKGCRMANPGEFSMRAFRNGKLDLSQAESIADLISSKSKIEHKTALKQLRGGFSNTLEELRKRLIDFASLIELELDFSEEDVEFANRKELNQLLIIIQTELKKLITSFKLGNVIKNGIPVAIIGAPNAGKSTLLNTLVNEEKAIVSEIAGTTRDAIEDELIIDGIRFRFIDTAGIRDTNDTIEIMGIQKSIEKAKKAEIILFLIDASNKTKEQINQLKKIKNISENKILVVINKIDLNSNFKIDIENPTYISAKNKTGIKELKEKILNIISIQDISNNDIIITNLRHYEELQLTLHEIKAIINGIEENISTDLLTINIRQALFHLGSITGSITTDDLLGNIFSKFCIGK